MSDVDRKDIFAGKDPIQIFRDWYTTAKKSEINDPDAIALATVNKAGAPNVRMVLLRFIENDGFVFFTNYNSQKGNEILDTGKAAFVCHWKSLRRQIRVRGNTEKENGALADSYFKNRSVESRLGAWASKQSQPLPDRDVLTDRFEAAKVRYEENPSRPNFWGGFRLKPLEIEFWSEGEHRLHDRFLWQRAGFEKEWLVNRLYP